MKNLKTVFLAFREMHRLEKRLIPTAVTVALVTAVMPFVNIWFTSKIIDLLEGGAGMKSLALYIGLAVGINAVLFFINYYLGDMQFVYRSLMYNKELQRISSKLFGMEYQCLENSDFQALVHKHSEAQDRVFSSFVQLTWMMRDFISGALTLLISVVLVVPLFKIGFQTTGASFFERPAFLLTIFGAIAVMAVIILVVAVKMNRAWFQASDEYSRLDRIFYYFLNLFSDYNTGKEIRIYKEQELIKHTATDKLLTEGEGILKKASMNTAKQSSFVAILGALVGFGIYLFIGAKGLYGLFGIGSLVLYCGAFMQIIAGIMKMAVTFGKTAEMVPLVHYYFQIINTKDEMTYGDKELDLSGGFQAEFKNVSFKYPGAESYALQNVLPEDTAFEGILMLLNSTRYQEDFRNLLPWPIEAVSAGRAFDGRSVSLMLVWGPSEDECCSLSLSGRQIVVSRPHHDGFLIYHPTDPKLLNWLAIYLANNGEKG